MQYESTVYFPLASEQQGSVSELSDGLGAEAELKPYQRWLAYFLALDYVVQVISGVADGLDEIEKNKLHQGSLEEEKAVESILMDGCLGALGYPLMCALRLSGVAFIGSIVRKTLSGRRQ